MWKAGRHERRIDDGDGVYSNSCLEERDALQGGMEGWEKTLEVFIGARSTAVSISVAGWGDLEKASPHREKREVLITCTSQRAFGRYLSANLIPFWRMLSCGTKLGALPVAHLSGQ